MKRMKGVSIEFAIILSIFTFVNYCLSQNREPPEHGSVIQRIIPWGEVPYNAKDLRTENTEALNFIYQKFGYGKGSSLLPALGYDPKSKRLIPYNLRAMKYITDRPLAGYETAIVLASFRDSVVISNNHLEDRVRKLENTVNRIINRCCPEAKE